MKKTILTGFMFLAAFLSSATLLSAADAVNPQKTAKVLNNLVELNIDAEKGFKEAAENVPSASLKSHFIAKSEERRAFAEQLREHLRKLNQQIDQKGTVTEAARRAWLDVKTAVTQNDDKAVLEVAKSQQAKSVAEYRDALRKNLTDDVRNLIAQQGEKVEDCYDWINKQLRDEQIEEGKKNN